MADDRFSDDSFSDSDEILESGSGYDGKYEYELGINASDNEESEFVGQDGSLSVSLEVGGDKVQNSPKQKKVKKINFGWKKKQGKKKKPDISNVALSNPVFGVPLSVAVQRSVLVDGLELPTVFRECIDFLEEKGLDEEGIYRLPGVKSQVEAVKNVYDRGEVLDLSSCDVHTVASLLKLFLRQLPEPLFPPQLSSAFEKAASGQSEEDQIAALAEVISTMPSHNRLLLGWLMVHISHITENSSVNLMTGPNVIVVFQPTLQSSYPVLSAIIKYTERLFPDVQFIKYEAPEVVEQPSAALSGLVGELGDYDNEQDLLAAIQHLEKEHSLVMSSLQEKFDSVADNQAWEIQRLITEFRRKLKGMKRAKKGVSHGNPKPHPPVEVDVEGVTAVDSTPQLPSVDQIEATMAAELQGILSKTEVTLRQERNALLVIRETLRDQIEQERALIAAYKTHLQNEPEPQSDCDESGDEAVLEAKFLSALKEVRDLRNENETLKEGIMEEMEKIALLRIIENEEKQNR